MRFLKIGWSAGIDFAVKPIRFINKHVNDLVVFRNLRHLWIDIAVKTKRTSLKTFCQWSFQNPNIQPQKKSFNLVKLCCLQSLCLRADERIFVLYSMYVCMYVCMCTVPVNWNGD